ncbi:hypothetical protein [Lacrimispora sp.]|uniref:hypothetical protein n=1 Tax=Lacrimispora sp. TaxID=2719234 RepID=UPI0028AB33C4|nr:hypothetical protein [Lacrimispora sp.]
MGKYKYDPKVYGMKVTFTGFFCTVLLFFSVVKMLTASALSLWFLVCVICTYTVWETFISLSNPSVVIMDGGQIVFEAFGRRHSYRWEEISCFRVREFTGAKKLFLRINNAGFLKGRYWLNCYYFNNSDLLYKQIVDIELSFHPDSIKARARRGASESAARAARETVADRETEKN